ncbi:hypothetical protein OFN60_32950, partial [Escherichia coli]|nr:hypothetical protein [Escherichia coli]
HSTFTPLRQPTPFHHPTFVMAGLDPAILAARAAGDGRVKPGHDGGGGGAAAIAPQPATHGPARP